MKRPTQVLVVVEAEIATTHLLMQVLRAAKPDGIEADLVVSSHWRYREIPADVAPIFVRCADPNMLPYARALVKQGRSYIYYLDDDFWALDPETPLGAYYADPVVRASLDYFVSNAALVLTNTPQLATRVRQFASQVSLVPTFFKFDLLDGVAGQKTDEIRIGFAGSVTRTRDLELIKPAIASVLAANPLAVFEFIGAMPAGIGERDRIRYFPPIADYESFIRFQASRNWSIGLAPLLASTANNSKTDNKFREYAACSVAGIYSDFGPYPAVVKDGVDGFLVTDDCWTDAIVGLAGDGQRLDAMRQAARATAIARYDITAAAKIWAITISGAVDKFGPMPAIPLAGIRLQIKLQSIVGLLGRVRIAYRHGGMQSVLQKSGVWISRRFSGGGGRD